MYGLPAARIALFAILLHVCSLASAAICYVKSDAAGSNTGTSWANAYTDLQSALASYPGCQLVYVARGTYTPTQTTDRTASFNIKPGVAVYGGFAGTEADLGARLLPANPTVLSGDIGVAGNSSDNSYHVVVMDGTTASGTINASTFLSDLTISDGNGNSSAFGANQDRGGGLYCVGSGAGHECSPELDSVIFQNNRAWYGGALYSTGASGGKASPELHNVILRDNAATYSGGAMNNDGSSSGTSSPLIDGATFSGNSALTGGAIFNGGTSGVSSPTIRNATFYGNAAQAGGAIANGGSNGGHASPVLRHVTFSHNQATAGAGGAIYNYAASNGDAAPSISGAIFWADQATSAPYEMATLSPTTPTLDYSISPECLPASVSCASADPLLGPLQDNDGFSPTLKPDVGSPAIDAGAAATCPPIDQRGITRPQGSQCDIGAVELRASETRRCYVDTASAGNNGLSWATAYQRLHFALGDANCTEVWVAKGTYNAANILDAAAFFVPPGKAVYGGFSGTETARSQRDPIQNETVLDGAGIMLHVVAIDATGNATNVGASTILDGFTITGGNANGSGINQYAGGLLCNGHSGYTCNPTLSNLVFKNNSAVSGGALLANGSVGGMSSPNLKMVTFSANHASQYGGAVLSTANGGGASSPTYSNVVFNDNTSDQSGGAVYIAGAGGVSRPPFTDTVFQNNSAPSGGAVLNDAASPTFQSTTFSGNHAQDYGGAVYSHDTNGVTDSRFTSVLFAGNSATFGGAVYDKATKATSILRVERTTFADNAAVGGGYGGGMDVSGKTDIRDTLFARNAGDKGGAILGEPAAQLTVDQSSFVGNRGASAASAIFVYGSALVTNATFWNNVATGHGGTIGGIGAIGYNSDIVLRNLSFAGNTGGSVFNFADLGNSASLTISNSILWNTTVPGGQEISVYGSGTLATTIDHSIVQNGCPAGATCSTVSAADPLLGLFQSYGGFTPTLMPAANSPALNVAANCPATDQRGVARPQGAGCDIGAVERRAVEDYLFNNGFDW